MSVPFVRYDPATGEIIVSGTCPKSDLELQADGMAVLEGQGTRQTHYVKNGALVAFPPMPDGPMQWDSANEQWVDPRTLADLQAEKWGEIKQARADADASSFVWNGSRFDSDPVSQARIQGGVLLATIQGPAFTIDWTLADNTVRTLSQTDMISVGIAMAQHVEASFKQARTLRAQILAASKAADLDAIAWTPAP